MENIFDSKDIDKVFVSKKGHPLILKSYLSGDTSIETMVILDKIFGFRQEFDKNIQDPVWETVSLRMRKYSPFLHIDVFRYKKVLKNVVLGEK